MIEIKIAAEHLQGLTGRLIEEAENHRMFGKRDDCQCMAIAALDWLQEHEDITAWRLS